CREPIRNPMTPKSPLSFLVLLCTVAACSGTERRPERAPDPLVEASLVRYREPFTHDQTIIAEELDIEMTSNFFADLAQPSVDPGRQSQSHTKTAEADEYRWINRTGRTEVPLRLALGKQQYRVVREARLRVLTGNVPVRLRVLAGGDVKIVEGSQARSVQEL